MAALVAALFVAGAALAVAGAVLVRGDAVGG